MWDAVKGSEKIYLETLKILEPNQSSVILAAALASRLNALNNISLFDEYVVSTNNYLLNFIL